VINIKYKDEKPSERWEKQKDLIIKEYLDGVPLKKIGLKYGHDKTNVRKKLLSWGIKVKSQSEANQRYEINSKYFKNIDTHDKAYWLGFIYADGCVCVYPNKSKKSLSIGLSKKDRHHLQKFLNCVGSEKRPIYDYKDGSSIIINNIELVDDLIKLGVTPRKSLNLTFPKEDQVPSKFINSFLLGYFDGDGCIQKNLEKNRWAFSMIGTIVFMEKVSDLFLNLGIKKTKIKVEKRCGQNKIGEICYCGTILNKRNYKTREKTNKKIYDFLYKDCYNICLERKFIKFKSLISNE
jgi:hypothetical protein